ncbi:hypothetical protein TrVGV298_010359 [Trichoderma virens]|nr:hypothetical protein TrVGV298_010359 [Trichoderma virens]
MGLRALYTPSPTIFERGAELDDMLKPSRIDRIKHKTEKVKELFSSPSKDEDGSVSFSVTRQPQESRHSHGSSVLLPVPNTSDSATDDNEYRNTPIGELWNLAYKKLQQQDGALIREYEARLRDSVTGALSSALGAEEDRGGSG